MKQGRLDLKDLRAILHHLEQAATCIFAALVLGRPVSIGPALLIIVSNNLKAALAARA